MIILQDIFETVFLIVFSFALWITLSVMYHFNIMEQKSMTLYGLLEKTSFIFELKQINKEGVDSETNKTSISSLKDFLPFSVLHYSTHTYCMYKISSTLWHIW